MTNQTTRLLDLIDRLITASSSAQLVQIKKETDHQLFKEAWQLLSKKRKLEIIALSKQPKQKIR